MRRLILLFGLALAVGVLLPGSGLADVGGSELPFKGTRSGYGTTNLLTGQTQSTLTGRATHFGLGTLESQSQFVPTATPDTFDYFGTWTMTAANGDQMFGTTTGVVTTTPDGHATILGHYVSSGGTGRFANATLIWDSTGQGTSISVDPAGIETSFFEGTGVGTLSY